MDVLFYACTLTSINKYIDTYFYKSKDLSNSKK